LKEGDYVLATKYNDGDPHDQFAIGFFSGMMSDRFLVVDGNGQRFRYSGFRRCERISEKIGNALVKLTPIISDKPGKSLWYWRRNYSKMLDFTWKWKNV